MQLKQVTTDQGFWDNCGRLVQYVYPEDVYQVNIDVSSHDFWIVDLYSPLYHYFLYISVAHKGGVL